MSTRMARSLQIFYRHLSCQSISLPSVYRLNLSDCCTPNQFRFYLPSSSLIPTTVLHSDKSKDEGGRAPRGTSSEFATRLFICCGGRIIPSQCCVTFYPGPTSNQLHKHKLRIFLGFSQCFSEPPNWITCGFCLNKFPGSFHQSFA